LAWSEPPCELPPEPELWAPGSDPDGVEPDDPDGSLTLVSSSLELVAPPPEEERPEPPPSDEPAPLSEPEAAVPVTDPEPDPEPP
jgi:hypothetical protein